MTVLIVGLTFLGIGKNTIRLGDLLELLLRGFFFLLLHTVRMITHRQRTVCFLDIRRLSFILIAQRLGLGLAEIERELASLPRGRTPTVLDWQRISRSLRSEIDSRIQLLTRTRNKLDECIGCGCLSLDRCALYNKEDRAAAAGPGPRFVLD